MILYTSGSTGEPKGVPIAGNFLAAIRPHMQFGVDLQPGGMFWPTDDPGGYGFVCCHAKVTSCRRNSYSSSGRAAPRSITSSRRRNISSLGQGRQHPDIEACLPGTSQKKDAGISNGYISTPDDIQTDAPPFT